MFISEEIIKPNISTYSEIKDYLDSLSIKEIEILTPAEIAEHLNVDKGTAGVYLYEYRVMKNITLFTTKQEVFNYLKLLSDEEFSNITYTKLAKGLKINVNTASVYLTEYRKFLKQETPPDTKSLMKLVFEFMTENPDKRTTVDIANKFPLIEIELISSYVNRWYRLHPDLQMKKGAMGIAKLKNWTEEELDYLRMHQYRVYCRIMKRLGKVPKSKKSSSTMEYFEKIKGELSDQERIEYTQEKALESSISNTIMLLKEVAKTFPEINFKKTQVMIKELRKRITKLGKDRPATTIVGTAIYLANREISSFKTNKIMKKFGKCSRASINQLCDILRIKKRVTEHVEVSLKLLKKISKEYLEIDYKKTEKVVRKIKSRLVKATLDRPTTTVVGTAICLANEGLTQARINEIMVNFTNCRPMNLTRLLKLLDM